MKNEFKFLITKPKQMYQVYIVSKIRNYETHLKS